MLMWRSRRRSNLFKLEHFSEFLGWPSRAPLRRPGSVSSCSRPALLDDSVFVESRLRIARVRRRLAEGFTSLDRAKDVSRGLDRSSVLLKAEWQQHTKMLQRGCTLSQSTRREMCSPRKSAAGLSDGLGARRSRFPPAQELAGTWCMLLRRSYPCGKGRCTRPPTFASGRTGCETEGLWRGPDRYWNDHFPYSFPRNGRSYEESLKEEPMIGRDYSFWIAWRIVR